MHMLEDSPEHHLDRMTPALAEPPANEADVQRKRMLMALGILLVALVAVIFKDWDFWFPPDTPTEAAVRSRAKRNVTPVPSNVSPSAGHEHKQAKAPIPAAPQAPTAANTERATLPPLEVEVVAGNRRVGVPAKSNAINVDIDTGENSTAPRASTTSASAPGASASNASAANAAAPGASAPITRVPILSASNSAGERARVSPQASQTVTVSVPPSYPLLAREMKVQGAVSLRALISREGNIQDLQILSGPAILAAAAREAVKQWHFKPYVLDGQPVETQARITVNFTISTN